MHRDADEATISIGIFLRRHRLHIRACADTALSLVECHPTCGVSAVSDVRVKCPRTDIHLLMIDEKRHGSVIFKARWDWHDVCHIRLESFVSSLDGEPP
ncbi:hypothetical protein [Rhodanobacter panaciterrae]|uniref:hypothetical protein n=1 Tax=Rhodanobacter panaciterrae TaxID=490572 RepID=UPI001678279D|nr:hypothetical protein [Rhodanobacter panaciterrae]